MHWKFVHQKYARFLCVQFVTKMSKGAETKTCHSRVDVLKLRTLVACQKDKDNSTDQTAASI